MATNNSSLIKSIVIPIGFGLFITGMNIYNRKSSSVYKSGSISNTGSLILASGIKGVLYGMFWPFMAAKMGLDHLLTNDYGENINSHLIPLSRFQIPIPGSN
jgi:hypothetical protein